MIDAYVYTTPNGFKALIGLEELGLPYETNWIDITKGEQMSPEYLAINPNNKIPAIVDRDGPGGKPITVFESGAVLVYLAEKTGKLLPKSGPAATRPCSGCSSTPADWADARPARLLYEVRSGEGSGGHRAVHERGRAAACACSTSGSVRCRTSRASSRSPTS